MKIYFNERTHQFYKEGELMKRKLDNGVVFYGIPTKAQLKEWGYVDWSQEGRLQNAKDKKIAKIDEYDKSSRVNEFIVTHDGQVVTTHWFEPNIRANYKNSVESAELVGMQTVSFYVGNMPLTLSTQDAKMMLAQIQLYADACYIVTQQHKAAIEALETIEAVDAYDYTTGYPNKLSFDV